MRKNDIAQLLPNLVIFAHVVEEGSFSAAGRAMSLSPSAISRQVDRIEDVLGVMLLNRTTRKLHLTEAGRETYERVKEIMSSASTLVARAQAYGDAPRGLLRVTAPVTLGKMVFAPLVSSFLDAYPDVDMEMDFSDRIVDPVSENFDLAVRVTDQPPQSLVARPLMPIHYVLACSADYGRPLPQSLEDLHQHAFLMPGDRGFRNECRFRNANAERLVVLRPRLIINNSDAMLDALLQNSGIALLPSFVAERLIREGRLLRLLPDWAVKPPRRDTAYILSLPNRLLPPKARVFIDFCRARLRHSFPP